MNTFPALSEHESKGLLSEWGVPITREKLVQNADDAVTAANEIAYPVVLKADVANMPHKTEAGLVVLGLQNEGAVRAAYDHVISNAGAVGDGNSAGRAVI